MTSSLTDLGYANQWDEKIPEVVRECRAKFHETVEIRLNDNGTLHKVACLKCGYFYLVDSSD
jgi:hypothetical protein